MVDEGGCMIITTLCIKQKMPLGCKDGWIVKKLGCIWCYCSAFVCAWVNTFLGWIN